MGCLIGISSLVALSGTSLSAYTLHLDSIHHLSIDTPLLYHAGDNPEWSQFHYDDKDWSKTHPLSKINEWKDFNGIGWFRMYIIVDSTLHNQPLGLQVQQLTGALQVFWNGNAVYSWGNPAAKKAKEKLVSSGPLPLKLQIAPRDTQILAIRYSNHWAFHKYQNTGKTYKGFNLTLGSYTHMLDRIQPSISEDNMIIGYTLFGFFVAIGISFLIFFSFNPSKINALFFSVFSLLNGLIFLLMLWDTDKSWISPHLHHYAGNLLTYSLPLYFTTLSGMLYFSFYRGIKKMFLVTVGLSLLCILSAFFRFQNYFSNALIIIYLSTLIWVLLDSFRIIGLAIYRKKPGSWIIGGGALGLLLFLFWGLTSLFLSYLLTGITTFSFSNIWALIIPLGAILSIPLSMSLYLAKDYAWTNQKRVQEEQEKQEILANQKENLQRQVQAKTKELQNKNEILEEHNREILASIKYASQLQQAILPDNKTLNELLGQHFILYYPRDVVSGDFYWVAKVKGKIIFSVADCTGHGVPGAFMSMMGNDLLNHIVLEGHELRPQYILSHLDEDVTQTLQQEGGIEEMRDGMDMALCVWDPGHQKLWFAGAKNDLYLVRNGQLKEYKASRFPVGGYFENKSFEQQEIQLQKSDTLFLFSDGYPDQFGGPKGKKYMKGRFKKLLTQHAHLPIDEQHKLIDEELARWMENEEQVDDISVLGLKIPSTP